MRLSLLSLLAALTLATLTGCGTSITREDTNTVRDLSGNWNATDSREVAAAMIPQVIGGPWIDRHLAANDNAAPVVKVYRVEVRNQTDEYIDPDIFTNDIIRSLINSGRVRAVRASGSEEATRREQRDQETNASAESRKEAFQELGADYLLTGRIMTQNDRAGRTSQRFYQIDLQLEHVTTGELVWLGSHEHSKLVERSRWGDPEQAYRQPTSSWSPERGTPCVAHHNHVNRYHAHCFQPQQLSWWRWWQQQPRIQRRTT